MKSRWTKEQLEAITRSGENIIVSAGAGSGKTAVLTERVLEKLKEKIHLNQLLILTFTNAAANEMKQRIRKQISKIPELKEELDYLDLAYITTFDAFALSMVKKYHYLLNRKPDIQIIDSSIIELKKRELLKEITQRYYEQKDPDFEALIHSFALKDDEAILKSILEIANKFDLIYEKEAFLNQYFATYFSEEFFDQKIEEYIELCTKKKNNVKTLLEFLSFEVENDYLEKMEEVLEPFFKLEPKDYFSPMEIKLPNLPRNTTEKAKVLKAELGKELNEFFLLTKGKKKAQLKEDLKQTEVYVRAIIKIIKDLDHSLMAYKRQYDLYEFHDIALDAISLLKQHPEVREELQQTFHEILVDEYQDTSDLQELFLKELAVNNLYMVGDIKQSIYRFRNANPNIFKAKYDSYSQNLGGSKIDLNKNFRSRNTVLEGINAIFNLLMDLTIGGADYKKEHQLIFGNTAYQLKGTTNQNMKLEIYDYRKEKDNPYQTSEIEAFMMAKDIKEKMESHYQVFDKEKGELREIEYSDFAVLVDQKKNFDLYKKIFTYFNIPSEIHKEESLNDSKVVTAIKNILLLVVSEKMDQEARFYYTSIARSFLYPYSDTKIMEILTTDSFSSDLIMEHIQNLRSDVSFCTPKEMIEKILVEFSFYEKLTTIGNIEGELSRIDYLLELAENTEVLGYDVFQFAQTLKELKEEQMELKFSRTLSGNNAVKIMTIHKSKGLEFYICYYPELSHGFNFREVISRFTYSNSLGIVTPIYDGQIKSTIYPTLLKEEYLKEEISEKLRVFYVALTRAKEKIILLADLGKEKTSMMTNHMVSVQTRLQYRSFLDLLCSIKEELEEFIMPYDLESLKISREYQKSVKGLEIDVQKESSPIIQKELQIPNEIEEEIHYSHSVKGLISYEQKMVLEAGNLLHYALEVLDLKNPNISMLPVSDAVKSILYTFLNQEIVSDIQEATVYQEYEFFTGEDSSGHGVIDLLLEYPDKIKIIDYKLKNIEPKYYEKQLLGYQKYIAHLTKKPVELYLYSLLEGTYKRVEEEKETV